MSSKSDSWQTAEDIRRDLFEYSDLEYPGVSFEDAPPKSIAEYKSRSNQVTNPGIFDQPEVTPEIFVSGRGRYLKDVVIRPGQPVESVPEDDYSLQRKIREVSGLGYRNEIIERVFAVSSSDAEEDEAQEQSIIPSVKLYSAKSGSISNSSSKTPSPSHLHQKLGMSSEVDNLKIEERSKIERSTSRKIQSPEKDLPCDTSSFSSGRSKNGILAEDI